MGGNGRRGIRPGVGRVSVLEPQGVRGILFALAGRGGPPERPGGPGVRRLDRAGVDPYGNDGSAGGPQCPIVQPRDGFLDVTHLDIGSVLAILSDHAEASPERLLFLWNLFEGVPKFYRDCYEQGVLDRRAGAVAADFLREFIALEDGGRELVSGELRGRYDVVLKFVARNPGRMHNELVHAIREASGDPAAQVGGYLKVLVEKFRLIESGCRSSLYRARRSRYYVTDNFLRAWLAALANPTAAIVFVRWTDWLEEADQRLADTEGGTLEKLVGQLHEERSRRGIGDFPLSQRIQGDWDRGDVEIDLVAVHEPDRRIRFGSCKRSPTRIAGGRHELPRARRAVSRHSASVPIVAHRLRGHRPAPIGDQPRVLARHDVIPQDLHDLTADLC